MTLYKIVRIVEGFNFSRLEYLDENLSKEHALWLQDCYRSQADRWEDYCYIPQELTYEEYVTQLTGV